MLAEFQLLERRGVSLSGLPIAPVDVMDSYLQTRVDGEDSIHASTSDSSGYDSLPDLIYLGELGDDDGPHGPAKEASSDGDDVSAPA